MAALRELWRRWHKLGQAMAELFSRLLFALLYIGLFAPVALVAKLSGRRFLPTFDRKSSSYYLPKEKVEPTIEFLRRQG